MKSVLVIVGCAALVGFYVLVRWALDQPLDVNVKSVARPSEPEIATGVSVRYRHLHAESVSFKSCRIKHRRMGAFILGAFRILELMDENVNLPFPAEMGEEMPSAEKAEISRRFALALAPLCFILVGIPLGMRSRRKLSGFVLAGTLVLLFGYYMPIIVAAGLDKVLWLHSEFLPLVPVVACFVLSVRLLKVMG